MPGGGGGATERTSTLDTDDMKSLRCSLALPAGPRTSPPLFRYLNLSCFVEFSAHLSCLSRTGAHTATQLNPQKVLRLS
jgi:hypothetical protein